MGFLTPCFSLNTASELIMESVGGGGDMEDAGKTLDNHFSRWLKYTKTQAKKFLQQRTIFLVQ
jgi:hypothetical protein